MTSFGLAPISQYQTSPRSFDVCANPVADLDALGRVACYSILNCTAFRCCGIAFARLLYFTSAVFA